MLLFLLKKPRVRAAFTEAARKIGFVKVLNIASDLMLRAD
jgi:hypothetical protein